MYYIIMWALVLIQGLELQVPLQLIHGDASLGSDQKLRATPRQSYCWVIVATRYIGKMTLELHVIMQCKLSRSKGVRSEVGNTLH